MKIQRRLAHLLGQLAYKNSIECGTELDISRLYAAQNEKASSLKMNLAEFCFQFNLISFALICGTPLQ